MEIHDDFVELLELVFGVPFSSFDLEADGVSTASVVVSVVEFLNDFFYLRVLTIGQLVENVVGEFDVLFRVVNNFVESVSFFLGVQQQVCEKVVVALGLFIQVEVFEQSVPMVEKLIETLGYFTIEGDLVVYNLKVVQVYLRVENQVLLSQVKRISPHVIESVHI